MNRRGLIVRLIVAAVLLAAISWLAFQRAGLESIALRLPHFGRWAPLLFIGVYGLAAVLFVPGAALTLAGGALFGPLWGTLWNLLGATLGAALAFVAARYLAAQWVSRWAGEKIPRLMGGVEEEGWRFVAFVRLVPLFPFNVVNYAFGLTRIRLGEYLLASLVCMAPGALAYTYLGYTGREAAAANVSAIRDGIIALALLATVAFLPRLVRRLRRAEPTSTQQRPLSF